MTPCDHLEILDLCASGCMGSQAEWLQLRPACAKAAAEIRRLRADLARLRRKYRLVAGAFGVVVVGTPAKAEAQR